MVADGSVAVAAGSSVPDNLKLIVGVGPVLEKTLNDAGVTTFERLAAMSVQQVQDLLPDFQDARVVKEDRLGQARRFADARWRGDDPVSLARENQVT